MGVDVVGVGVGVDVGVGVSVGVGVGAGVEFGVGAGVADVHAAVVSARSIRTRHVGIRKASLRGRQVVAV